MVYLIHFEQPLHHAQHYIGCVEGGRTELLRRLSRHRRGVGAKLMRAVTKAGIDWMCVETWPNLGRGFERWLKNQKNAKRYCPMCREER